MIRSIKEMSVPMFAMMFVITSIIFSGCTTEPTSTPSVTASTGTRTSAGNAPPLKIALVEADSLESELALRWQTFSDQGLQIQNMSRRDFSTQDVSTLDIVIYPANLMGTLVSREWIAPVPIQVRERIGGWDLPTGSNAEESAPVNLWPARWRSMSMCGGKPMAVPLGAPSWIAITRTLDPSALTKLHERIASNQLSSESSAELWEEFLSSAELANEATQAARETELAYQLEQVSDEAKRHLVSRYLWLVSSTESRYRGLFDMYKILSRWSQPEFLRAALHLRRLGVLQPSTLLASPTDAWESVASGDAVFGLGWPRTDREQRLSEKESDHWTLIPIVWNDGSGLMASLGRRTRQSANASQFLIWLSSDEQRSALQLKSSAIELLEMDNDLNRIREDYRDYQTLQRLESSNVTMELTPRFLDSDQFLDLLGDALIDILKDPSVAESRLAQCRLDWDGLIDQVGREKLRSSLEAASGYAK
jgi:hypothetical protein